MLLDISRHKELFDPRNFDTPINIIGAGATGSWLALFLAKLGITNITIYDFDKVEEHNIPNQAYDIINIGSSKVHSLFGVIRTSTGIDINTFNGKYTNQRLTGIVFLMVDSMTERKRIWEEAIKFKPLVNLLIEPRMGINLGRIYNVIPTDLNHIKQYEKTYYNDDFAEVSACGNTMSVITTAVSIAAWCGRQLINYHNNEDMDNEILIDFKFNNIITERWV